ncbi:MAG: hypothetical protein SPK08_07650 [Candidatus Cryptobacteroides sp.]|nr:hypothetical protein [Rikenellaceae bacterium]MDY5747387.1 hypothetical protein [Candidatus Cryptobacteroides sp.]
MPRKKKTRKYSAVDPGYLDRQKESLKRNCRKTVLFNAQELAAIDEYCTRFKVSSRSALIRKSVMEHVLEGLEKNHPTLF